MAPTLKALLPQSRWSQPLPHPPNPVSSFSPYTKAKVSVYRLERNKLFNNGRDMEEV